MMRYTALTLLVVCFGIVHSRPHNDEECVDKEAKCKSVLGTRADEMCLKYNSIMRESCRKSCGFCNCVDKESKEYCDNLVKGYACIYDKDMMWKDCKSRCSFCDKPNV
ncbi:predicted protein [Nematostella vectensis]|uniref:ShKT domain-containing protein n=1 Tax=Nematostella vectensis TaxID=45351 RepID=A7RH73_NEMVE|nr:uncharacterized protein LOC5521450 [Nematostella vectensis]EDO49171.1 predicted protein [Nematostella vectensis]|eukprot:XP_001641234.1 predicted protein [Nematostella vectensis]